MTDKTLSNSFKSAPDRRKLDTAFIDSADMPKRFPIGPLGEHDDQWLLVWAVLSGKSKSALATVILGNNVNESKDTIREMLAHSAALRGMEPDDLFRAILANPKYLEENPVDEASEDEA